MGPAIAGEDGLPVPQREARPPDAEAEQEAVSDLSAGLKFGGPTDRVGSVVRD